MYVNTSTHIYVSFTHVNISVYFTTRSWTCINDFDNCSQVLPHVEIHIHIFVRIYIFTYLYFFNICTFLYISYNTFMNLQHQLLQHQPGTSHIERHIHIYVPIFIYTYLCLCVFTSTRIFVCFTIGFLTTHMYIVQHRREFKPSTSTTPAGNFRYPVGTPVFCCTSVLQCVAVCCNAMQCVAACCSMLQHVAVCCSMLQCVAACCSKLQCVAVCCSVMQYVAACCSVLQCVAVCCSVLQ